MKWLFSLLLIANLGMFIWLYPQQDRGGNASQQSQDFGELRLAGEASEAAKNTELPGETKSDLVEESSATPEVAETTSPTQSIKQEPPTQEATPEMASTVSAERPQDGMQCRTIGVFEKRSQAELLSVQLLALGLKPEITSETRNEQAGYWVLIPPQNNREAAIDVTKRLEEAGVADLWRFTSGNLAHAISLGLFRDLERAQARKEQITELGFVAEVRPRYRQQTQYWLNYSFSGVSPITKQKWREFETMFPGIERSTANCL
jgi:hypothetical protein